MHALAVPFVVIEGELFEAYDNGSELKVDPVEHVVVEWRRPALLPTNYVHLMTINRFELSVAELHRSAAEWIDKASALIVNEEESEGSHPENS